MAISLARLPCVEANSTSTWIIRVLGLCFTVVTVYCCFAPISAAADVVGDFLRCIPCVGETLEDLLEGMVDALLCAVSCAIGCSCGLLVIAITWLVMRPLIGGGVLLVCMVLFCCAYAIGQQNKSNRNAARGLAGDVEMNKNFTQSDSDDEWAGRLAGTSPQIWRMYQFEFQNRFSLMYHEAGFYPVERKQIQCASNVLIQQSIVVICPRMQLYMYCWIEESNLRVTKGNWSLKDVESGWHFVFLFKYSGWFSMDKAAPLGRVFQLRIRWPAWRHCTVRGRFYSVPLQRWLFKYHFRDVSALCRDFTFHTRQFPKRVVRGIHTRENLGHGKTSNVHGWSFKFGTANEAGPWTNEVATEVWALAQGSASRGAGGFVVL